MCPARVRNRSQTCHVRASSQKSANLFYTLKWELLSDVQPCGQIKFQFPSFFPKKIVPPKLTVLEASETKTFSIQVNIDDAFVESLLHLPFIHIIRFPYDPNPPKISMNNSGSIKTNPKSHVRSSHKNLSECFLPEYLQIDCKQLLLPRRTSISYQCTPTGYKYFSFHLQIDRPLIDTLTIKRYSPVFIWFKSINNMPDVPYKQSELEKNYGPVFYKLIVNNQTYFIRPQSHSTRLSIDTYFIVLPRVQTDIYFEVHDRDTSLPNFNDCIGTGLIVPYQKEQDVMKSLYLDANALIQPHITTKTSYGFCSFHLLPARKLHIGINPSKETCVVSPGNFFESQTELSVAIIDPYEDANYIFNPNSIPNQEASTNNSKIKIIPNVPQLKNFQNLPDTPGPKTKIPPRKKSNNRFVEDNTTQYNRWIVSCSANDDEIFDQIQNAIDEFHMNQFEEKSKSILKTYNYDKGLMKTIDLITGFTITTPEEKFLIVESRASGNATEMLHNLAGQYSRRKFHILYDVETKFPFPRLYSGFDSLIKSVSIPLSVSHLLRIDGLYFHNSINSILFSIVQKLNYLLTCVSIQTADKCDFFPTQTEILQLLSKAEILASIPLQKGIPTIQNSRESKKIGHKNSVTSSGLYSSKDLNISASLARTSTNFNDNEIFQLKTENSLLQPKSTRTYNAKSKTALSCRLKHDELNTARTQRPRFEPYGKKKEEIAMSPRKRIGCTDNGDEEIWIVDNIDEIPVEDGWEIEVIRKPGKVISTSDYKTFNENTDIPLSERSTKMRGKERNSMKRPQTQLLKRKQLEK